MKKIAADNVADNNSLHYCFWTNTSFYNIICFGDLFGFKEKSNKQKGLCGYHTKEKRRIRKGTAGLRNIALQISHIPVE